jgi:hypothetical protein
MQVRIQYFTTFLTFLFFQPLHAQNDSLKYRSYPISDKYFVNYLGFIKPNVPLVPCSGGIYTPNWYLWYLKTKDSILSIEPSYIDTTLLITRTSKTLCEIVKVSLDTKRKDITPLILTQGFVFYATPSNFIKGLNFYVVGCHNTFYVCKLYNRKVDTLFHCDKMIDQLEVITQSKILFSYGSKLIIYPLEGKPSVLFDAQKHKIYGFTSDNAGGLYISIDSCIVKIDDKKQQTLISTNSIKGKLRFFNNKLYVLDADNRKLFIIPTSSIKTNVKVNIKETKEQPSAVRMILTNSYVINMVKEGLPDKIIISVIKNANANFALSVDSIMFLSENKVSSPVIMEMKDAMKNKTESNSTSVQSPKPVLNADTSIKRVPVTVNELPAGITSYILETHKYFEITESYKIIYKANVVKYEVHCKDKDAAEVIDIFDSNGNHFGRISK